MLFVTSAGDDSSDYLNESIKGKAIWAGWGCPIVQPPLGEGLTNLCWGSRGALGAGGDTEAAAGRGENLTT